MLRNFLTFFIAAILSFALIYSLIPEPPVTKIYNEKTTQVKNIEKQKAQDLLPSYVLINNVPFTPQAPFADWQDIRQQEACEEASIVMAAYWNFNKNLSKQTALDEILKTVKFEEEKFGFHIHTDLEIAQEVLSSYFNTKNTKLKYNITINDIKKALANDSVVLVSMHGKKLKNPHFLNGGPKNHMILIIGYDDKNKIFITHDPGTRNGENYEYSYEIIEDSLYNYPSSNQEWTDQRPKTAMLSVEKSN
ncbi:hypothetical protein HOJ01_02770 [bacterium]|jgi:hypothetical protein|nr:hypothetical protein [bacterium]MBT6293707.1 hypothetical protein [bacterium]